LVLNENNIVKTLAYCITYSYSHTLTKLTRLFLYSIQQATDAIFSIRFIDSKQNVNKQARSITK